MTQALAVFQQELAALVFADDRCGLHGLARSIYASASKPLKTIAAARNAPRHTGDSQPIRALAACKCELNMNNVQQ